MTVPSSRTGNIEAFADHSVCVCVWFLQWSHAVSSVLLDDVIQLAKTVNRELETALDSAAAESRSADGTLRNDAGDRLKCD